MFCNNIVNNFNVEMFQKIKKNIIVFDSVNTVNVNDIKKNYNELTTKYLQSLNSTNLLSV